MDTVKYIFVTPSYGNTVFYCKVIRNVNPIPTSEFREIRTSEAQNDIFL